MTWLIASDLHLSDRPRDSYRWPIFRWLARQQREHNVTATYLLGDLTDRKDNHSSTLVNRFIDELLLLRPPIYLLRGNHDGLNPSNPYFRFLQTIEGLDFVVEPTVLPQGVAMIPHQPDQAAFDRACGIVGHKAPAVMMHQVLDGAVAESGSRLSGLRASLVEAKRPLRWYSGDVHSPQVLNCGLTYVGAPYHVRFGDDYDPRVLLVGNTQVDLHFPCLRKWVLRVGRDWAPTPRIRKGDHVKIIVTLSREEIVDWAKIKGHILDTCRALEVQVFGIELEVPQAGSGKAKVAVAGQSPKDTLVAFCQAEKVPNNIKQVGMELL
jgi:hypothetical protein